MWTKLNVTKRDKALFGNVTLITILLILIYLAVSQQPAWSIFTHLKSDCNDCYPALLIGACVGLLFCALVGSADPLVTSNSPSEQVTIGCLTFIFLFLVFFIDDIATPQFTAYVRLGAYSAGLIFFSYKTWLLWYYRRMD